MKKLLMLPLILMLASCGFEIVDDGYVGVKSSMGKVDLEEYLPGIHFYNPITTSIKEKSIREQSWEGNLSSYSSDNQVIVASFKANYRPVPTMVAELYINQGNDYIDVILPQRVTTPIKEVLGKYKATDLAANRPAMSKAAEELIRERLNGTNVELTSFEITNFDYDDAFEQAVKDKVIAKEKAIEEQNRTVQVIEKNKQKLNTEQTEAEAIRIKAAALAKNKDLIQLEAVKKWNGVLPTMSMGGALPFINVSPKQ